MNIPNDILLRKARLIIINNILLSEGLISTEEYQRMRRRIAGLK